MSIYEEKGICFADTLSQGKKAELAILQYFQRTYPTMEARLTDHRVSPFDLVLEAPSGRSYSVEIKSHKNLRGYPTFPAEVQQNISKPREESLPEYLSTNIDMVIQVDIVKGKAFVFKGSELRSYVLANPHKEIDFNKATSRGMLIGWTDIEAGYIGSFSIY